MEAVRNKALESLAEIIELIYLTLVQTTFYFF